MEKEKRTNTKFKDAYCKNCKRTTIQRRIVKGKLKYRCSECGIVDD